MSIKKGIEVDGQTLRGYVDIGTELTMDDRELASEALVIKVTAANSNWKIPVAYFLISSLTGNERAAIIKETLKSIHETDPDINIISITCDGPRVHQNMMECFGCNLKIDGMKTWFEHPVTNAKIYVIFDICHMLKLVRNNWSRLGQIKDPEGNLINWFFVEKLYKVQENESFYFGTIIRRAHVEWRKQSMKVKLAAQTLSASVADAVEFLEKDRKLPLYQGAETTVKFIHMIYKLFDLLNSRNPVTKCYKSPLYLQNKSF